jgi:SAM-dependent methyltransferase
MLLKPEQRLKLDNTEDSYFYSTPRFVTHIDDNFINQLTNLYRQLLQPETQILDLMSSWVSHLPEEMEFAHIEGHGMNEEELQRNPRLDHYFLQNLNNNPQLPFEDEKFDAVLNTVSIQYLQYPEAVVSEIARVLKPGGVAIVSFSNRMFYQKAISVWRDGTETDRVQLVVNYFKSVSSFKQPKVVVHQSPIAPFLQMLGIAGADPFYAVYAEKI